MVLLLLGSPVLSIPPFGEPVGTSGQKVLITDGRRLGTIDWRYFRMGLHGAHGGFIRDLHGLVRD